MISQAEVKWSYDMMKDHTTVHLAWTKHGDKTIFNCRYAFDSYVLYDLNYANAMEYILSVFSKELHAMDDVDHDEAFYLIEFIQNLLVKHAGSESISGEWSGLMAEGDTLIDTYWNQPKPIAIAHFARQLPGVNTEVEFPCYCHKGETHQVYNIIMHLNDAAGWTREKIADWIDDLHDNGIINAEFQPWDETGMAQEESQLQELDLKPLTEKMQQLAKQTKELTAKLANTNNAMEGLIESLGVTNDDSD